MKHHVDKFGQNLLLKMAVLSAFYLLAREIIPEVEGSIFPVIEPILVTEIEPSDREGWSVISGELRRNRDCAFTDMSLEVIEPGGYVIAGYQFLEPSRVRQDGVSDFGPWLIQVSPDQLKNTRIHTSHDCHAAWPTITSTEFVLLQ